MESSFRSIGRHSTIAVGVGALIALIGYATLAYAGGTPKVVVCHTTSSETNPEVVITVSENALQTHLDHGDALWDEVYGCEEGPGDPV